MFKDATLSEGSFVQQEKVKLPQRKKIGHEIYDGYSLQCLCHLNQGFKYLGLYMNANNMIIMKIGL